MPKTGALLLGAVIRGVVTTILAAAVLSLTLMLFFPELTDPYPPPPPAKARWANVIGVAVWVVALGAGYLVAWRTYRRNIAPDLHEPRCANCGYNLTGNVSGRCPECGTDIAQP